ncbi:hypothetical protein [Amycolatopsis sp.]|uniref:hypothetical protein n=1 Tax=Amycolatopsis sp. TaxID=37632 RepID=UPI002D093B39|nr:hypothetical protein [Amycolatopsis sp.]HVV11598.1 hypothetical protein [Amycolatopsis sp.]
MATITPQDTCDHFIGSGALSYSWWRVSRSHGTDTVDAPDDWSVTVREYDPDMDTVGDKAIVFDHKALSRAVNTLARTAKDKRPEYLGEHVLRECRTFVADPENADFDAAMADEVLQYIAFGKVIYG